VSRYSDPSHRDLRSAELQSPTTASMSGLSLGAESNMVRLLYAIQFVKSHDSRLIADKRTEFRCRSLEMPADTLPPSRHSRLRSALLQMAIYLFRFSLISPVCLPFPFPFLIFLGLSRIRSSFERCVASLPIIRFSGMIRGVMNARGRRSEAVESSPVGAARNSRDSC